MTSKHHPDKHHPAPSHGDHADDHHILKILHRIEEHLVLEDARLHALKHQLDRVEARVKKIQDEIEIPSLPPTVHVEFAEPQPKH